MILWQAAYLLPHILLCGWVCVAFNHAVHTVFLFQVVKFLFDCCHIHPSHSRSVAFLCKVWTYCFSPFRDLWRKMFTSAYKQHTDLESETGLLWHGKYYLNVNNWCTNEWVFLCACFATNSPGNFFLFKPAFDSTFQWIVWPGFTYLRNLSCTYFWLHVFFLKLDSASTLTSEGLITYRQSLLAYP